MNAAADRRRNILACIGLVIGAVLGMLGTMVSSATVRDISWAIDSSALVMATSLLALKFFRKGCDVVAAGFLVYAIGEAVMLSGTANSLEASVPAFGAGVALWSVALLLVSTPNVLATWVRLVGIVAAILFGITAIRIFAGTYLSPIASPLPYFGYPFLVLTFIGWIWTLLREKDSQDHPGL